MTKPFRSAWTWIERLRSRRLLSEGVRHDGLVRSYLLYVPRHLQGNAALPLVVVLHGGAGWPEAMAKSSGMHQIAEREGFIVAYPAGTAGRAGLTWNPGGGQWLRSDIDDVGFLRKLIAELQRRYAIDPNRIYVAGMSIGGALAYQLACAMSESLAAIGVVAGVMTSEACHPAHPVSVIHIHGTADQRVPMRGGKGRFTARHNNWPPVRQGIERWCEINHCGKEEVIRLVDGLVGRRYSGAADVELWLVEGGRHVWPGPPAASGWRWWWQPLPAATVFSASEKVWNFFAAHPKR